MRLIDADAVFEKFSKEYKETTKLISSGECHLDNLAEGFTECHEIIKSMPTIDAVPVVRCKDCIHAYHWDGAFCCVVTNYACEGDDFCSYGEKKEDT